MSVRNRTEYQYKAVCQCKIKTVFTVAVDFEQEEQTC